MLSRRLGGQDGSAVVESVFAIVILLVLVLGAVEVAFVLYARNVVAAAAHEGARAGVELGRDPANATVVAEGAVARAAGGLVDDLDVATSLGHVGTRAVLRVNVSGVVRAFGPVPVPIPLNATATVVREVRIR